MPAKKWSAEAIVASILQLHRSNEKLNSAHIQKTNPALFKAARDYCGSWKQAIAAAGLDYKKIALNDSEQELVWSEDIVLRTIRGMYEQMYESHEPLNYVSIRRNHSQLFWAADHYFGSWSKAVLAAGPAYPQQRLVRRQKWSRLKVLSEIRRHRRVLTSRDYPDLYQAAIRHFGPRGWAIARTVAGYPPLDPDGYKIWDKRIVIEAIKKLHENELPLNALAVQRSEYSRIFSAGVKYFGSWENAVCAAGFDYGKIRKLKYWTREDILAAIRDLAELGFRLNAKAMEQSHSALCSIARVWFGSWSQAVEAAGISYREHLFVFSTKAWLRNLNPDEYQTILGGAAKHAQTRSRRRKK